MATYDALQLFLDESGRLVGHPDLYDPLLVGGVVLIGSWDRADDTHLRSVLKRRLTEVGGRYPADLHFSESALTPALPCCGWPWGHTQS